ncbi:DUF2530 domain-containing protein [Arsenicicoccus sp. oral taxon 190]|uniref:DUF2530 domain-containing protein n=1 Tax=Arsenicicoccus sp. oral taxon 190 TaxID=1658671 RepID=UPI00067A0142|nr:DUF2530 domain-containing protein [Arsenicicoccus sp. oral taxon 190]AKT50236.1 hypothetical protein ADJ73_00875 [Arsenicicoccus sp. oral taxon 190]
MSDRRPRIDPASIRVMRVRTDRVVALGLGLWLVALVVVLLVPALHGAGREWWPWVCVAGLGIGVIGYAYVRSGRGADKGA